VYRGGSQKGWTFDRVLQGVAVQRVEVCCNALQGVAGCCRVAGFCTVSCIVFENIYKLCTAEDRRKEGRLTVCCSVLQCVAVCCNVLQGVAGCCRVLRSVMHREDSKKGRDIRQIVLK